MTKDWKEIHPDFTPELKQEWEGRGFNQEQVRQWISKVSLRPKDADYVQWLRDAKKIDAEWMLNCSNNQDLKKEYRNYIIERNHRNVLLIGRTGNGKSTLANVLINKNDNFEEVFKESGRGASKTRKISDKIFEVNKILFD